MVALSGFLVYLRVRKETKDREHDAATRLLMGIAADKIIYLGMKYIDRGWVSKDEYQDLKHYLMDPYKELGGNGTVDRIMRAVDSLEFRSGNPLTHVSIVGRKDD